MQTLTIKENSNWSIPATDLIGKMLYINESANCGPVQGYVYHVIPERNLAYVVWNKRDWDDEAYLTAIGEWIKDGWLTVKDREQLGATLCAPHSAGHP